MKYVDLKQGSKEWLEYRKTHWNASEAGSVLGINPWFPKTMFDLWCVRTGKSDPFSGNVFTRHGVTHEAKAREWLSKKLGEILTPSVVEEGRFSCSLDGLAMSGAHCEIKIPFKGMNSELWASAAKGEIPEYYRAQIEHQFIVTGGSVCHFCVYDPAADDGIVINVSPDAELRKRIVEAWVTFQSHIDSDTQPEMTDRDVLIIRSPEWEVAALEFMEADRELDKAKAAHESARIRLIKLSEENKEFKKQAGCGVAVTRFWKKGNVDYKKIPQLAGLDLEPFRAKGREETRVSVLASERARADS